MARKNKSSDAVGVPQSSGSSRRHMSIGIDEAENGFTVNVSCEGKDGYDSKRFIAPNERSAIRIATQGISGLGPKGKEKKGKKKGKGKIALAKRG